MNRSERRKVENRMSVADMDKVLATQRHRILKNAAVDYATVVAFELFNKMKMPADDVKMVVEDLNGLFDDVIGDYLSIEDMRVSLKEEGGIIVK